MNKGFLNSPSVSKKAAINSELDSVKVMEERIRKSTGFGTNLVAISESRVVHNPANMPLKSILKGTKVAAKNSVSEGDVVNVSDTSVSVSCGSVLGNVSNPSTTVALKAPRISSNVALPMAALEEVKARFVNTLYGFSVGKKLAFPIVENYVKHAWDRFGFKRVMMHDGFLMFQFDSKDSMEKVLKNGPWRIQSVPVILNIYSPNTPMVKDNVSSVSLWIKLHRVPIVAYSKVGIGLIAAKVGKLIRLDEHTNFICLNSWGRSEYARVLVEVSAELPTINSVDIDIPFEDGKKYTTVTIDVEYEWLPPRCGVCKIFDHKEIVCPRKCSAGSKVKSDPKVNGMKDKKTLHDIGKKITGKSVSKQRYVKGYRMNIPKQKQVYRVVSKPQCVNGNSCNTRKSLDATTQPIPSSSYINDGVNMEELYTFVKKAGENSVLMPNAKSSTESCISEGTKDENEFEDFKSSRFINESDSDVEEVPVPDSGYSIPCSSFGGGHDLEQENYYDDYEDQFEVYPNGYAKFCDQFDFKVKGRGRN